MICIGSRHEQFILSLLLLLLPNLPSLKLNYFDEDIGCFYGTVRRIAQKKYPGAPLFAPPPRPDTTLVGDGRVGLPERFRIIAFHEVYPRPG